MSAWQPAARELLMQAETEYDRAHQRFDAIDTKAGLVLGFAATLLGLTFTVTAAGAAEGLLAASRAAGAVAGLAALVAAWPRQYKRMELGKIRQHLQQSNPDDALLDLMDQRIENVTTVAAAADKKMPWLTAALTALTVATMLSAAAALLA